MKVKAKRNCYAKNKDHKMILIKKGKVVDLPTKEAKTLLAINSAEKAADNAKVTNDEKESESSDKDQK